MPETYVCELCLGTFEKIVSDEQAYQEMIEIFGEVPEEETATICDPCFQIFMRTFN